VLSKSVLSQQMIELMPAVIAYFCTEQARADAEFDLALHLEDWDYFAFLMASLLSALI